MYLSKFQILSIKIYPNMVYFMLFHIKKTASKLTLHLTGKIFKTPFLDFNETKSLSSS